MDDVRIRLSIDTLRELITRAETGNYMLIMSDSLPTQWVIVEPYDPDTTKGI